MPVTDAPMSYMERKMPPKIEDMTSMNTDSRLTETSACLTSGVIPVSGLFIFRPWNIDHSFGLPFVLSKRCSKTIDSPLDPVEFSGRRLLGIFRKEVIGPYSALF